MGDRGSLKLIFKGGKEINFYTHWGGGSLNVDLAQALEAGSKRWTDPDYLARIIISQIIGDEWDSDAGFGISPEELDSEYPIPHVDLEAMTVDGRPYELFISYHQNHH